MSQREQLQEFRGAVFSADGDAVVSLLRSGSWPRHGIQLLGDGLLAALAQNVEGASEFALRCVAELRDRAWAGDEELADALTASLGAGPSLALRALPVDLDQFVDVLEGDPVTGGGYLDLHTGEVWPQIVFDDAPDDEDEDLDDEDRWLPVISEGSRDGYRDMETFTAAITEPDLADRIARTLEGRGAFRRFRRELTNWPDLEDRWYAYSAERRRGRARAWLADHGFHPRRPEPWSRAWVWRRTPFNTWPRLGWRSAWPHRPTLSREMSASA